ncbi:MAG: Druantia anti-phage system protein DruA [Nitrososphaeraceae archaeon]
MIQLERILNYKEKSDNTDRMLYRKIINKHHKYKKYVDYPGRRIDYFVKENEEIIGVLGIASAMLAISPRDNYIGWDKNTRLKNLTKIANNYRFCMIKQGYGSRVLSLLHKRASNDWQKMYGDRLFLLETMVEPPFTGTVYLSANWIKVGETKGFSFRRRISKALHSRGSKKRADLVKAGKYEEGNYEHCGKSLIEQQEKVIPKLIFVKPLHRYWRDKLLFT